MLTVAELTALLTTYHLRLTKRLGQHHLVDPRLIERIVDACQLARRDTVVEVGAGLGALTEPLARRAGRVIAVELDSGISRLLASRMAPFGNVTVVHADILRFAWEQTPGTVVVGAIPYQITSPLLMLLSEHRQQIRNAILVIQREVAQRLLAKPGTKAYGRFSIVGQFRWQIEAVVTVPRTAFFPRPAVESCCVRLTPRTHPPAPVDDEAFFFEVVKAAFAKRRKTLVNCLSVLAPQRIPRAVVEAALHTLHVPLTIRGEALSIIQLAALANTLQRGSASV
ncbi:MAG: ribosomal RNA small subunit methyltransferase A [Candidatus Omnitrophica bacterium]|nr:ribosomal RNA small subunit methyltransferase A [Candidatus Omnitrophota bacterium]